MSTSLADLLAGYSAEINARVEHNTDQEQNNADRKADSIESMFQSAKDNLEGLGGEIMGAGGAIHLGRKVYKRYKEKYGKKKADSTDDNNTGSQDDGTEDSRPDGEGGSGNDVAPNKAGQGGGTDDNADATSPADPSTQGDGTTDANDVSGQAADDAANDARSGDPTGTDPAAGDGASAADVSAPAPDVNPFSPSQFGVTGEDFAPPQVGTTTTQVGEDVAEGARTTTGDFGSDALGQVVRVRPTQIVQRTPQAQAQASGDAPKPPDAPTSAPKPPDAPPSGAGAADDAADAAENAARSGTGMFENLSTKVGDVANSVKGGIANMGKQIGTKLGITAGEEGGAETGGLLTAEGVMDALGPVGEIGGAILGLVGLFEGLFHHPKPVTEKAADSPVETQVGGIDPTALANKTQAVNTVV